MLCISYSRLGTAEIISSPMSCINYSLEWELKYWPTTVHTLRICSFESAELDGSHNPVAEKAVETGKKLSFKWG